MSRIAMAMLILMWWLAGSLAAWPQGSLTLSSITPASVAQTSEDAGAPVVKRPDAFFSGSVVESTEVTLVVSRTVLGKKERHSFAVTSDTKVEGRLRTGSRVTVRYAADDSGDSAILIVVRSGGAPAKKK